MSTRVNLALQGGGAHGAFTWGVLDQLLEDGRVGIDGISGTSAGAVNAVLLADGLLRGGPEAARARLAEFWRAVSVDGFLSPLQRRIVDRLFPFVASQGPWLGSMSQMLSPYDLNPLNINPLRELIEGFIDFDAIARDDSREIFVSATNVHTGELRVFTREEITADVVTASACLPFLFRAVEIDGIPYWDGGYSSNPPIVPFLRASASEDVLIVQIIPRERRDVATTARGIMSRVNEITFNAPLLSELRGIAFVNRLIEEGRLTGEMHCGGLRPLRLHRIAMDDLAEQLPGRSSLKRDYEHFETLRKLGQRATRRFLDTHYDDLGRRSTLDMVVDPAEPELVE